MAIAVARDQDEEVCGIDAASSDHVKLAGRDWGRAEQAGSLELSVGQRMSRATKLVLDISVAVVLLIVLAPLLALVVLLIQIESPGSPFYRARRVGYRGRPLDVLKFRKMPHDAKGLPLTLASDRRLTRFGAFMTRTRVDELPQLWNVVRGQMSLVGPRPEDARFVALHADEYRHILQVRPGITGWSQLAFAEETRILDQRDPVGHYVAAILPAKVRLDCRYAERPRLRYDIATMGWTALAMVAKVQVAVHRETGRMNRRHRPAPVPIVDTPR